MDLSQIVNHIAGFYYGHTAIAIAIGVAIVLLVCFRPKAMLKVVGILLIFALAAYAFTLVVDMAGSGRSQKSEMIHKVE